MVLDNQEIRTPYNYPDSYSADWRWQVAEIAAATPERIKKALLLDDEYITTAIATMKAASGSPIITEILTTMCSLPRYKEDPRVVMTKAHRMNEQDGEQSVTASMLQALLLCDDVTIQEICLKLGLEEDVVICYERVFFNCRDEDWIPLCRGIRRHLALGGQYELGMDSKPDRYWRYTGALHGHKLLYNEWGWELDDGVPVAAIAKSLQQDTLNSARRISASGATPKQSQAVMIEVVHRMLEDHAEGELDSDQQRIIELLTGLKPGMPEVTDEDLLVMDDELQKKLAAMQESADSKSSGVDTDSKDDFLRSQLEAEDN